MENKKVFPYKIRWAYEQDWNPAMEVIWRTFLKFEGNDYTEEGIRNFYEFITDRNLKESFLEGNYQLLVALDDKKVIGAASVRCRNFLSLLFVEENYHRQGVGRALMEEICRYMKAEMGERYVFLRSSPYAVNFYKRLGFREVAPEEVFSGIRVTPMEKVF